MKNASIKKNNKFSLKFALKIISIFVILALLYIKNLIFKFNFKREIKPYHEDEIIKYSITNYDHSNIRYRFDDLYNNRTLFIIDYSYLPYEKLDRSISYEENANRIYESTGMLNITKLDYYYNETRIKNEKMNHIHLAMGHDANYILLSLPSIASILNMSDPFTFIHFHFALLDCKFEDMKPIISLKKINKNVEFIFYNSKQAYYDFGKVSKGKKFGLGDYTKFLLPQIVNNTDKIIILDSADIMAQKDISEIYFFDLEDNYYGFSLDMCAGYFGDNKFGRNQFYPNIGVCIVNVRKFRENNLYKVGFISRLAYREMPCPAQEMFFLGSNYKFKFLPINFNVVQFFDYDEQIKNQKYNTFWIKSFLKSQIHSRFKYTLKEIVEGAKNPVILHLYRTKPYKGKANKRYQLMWINYVKMTGQYEKMKERYPKAFEMF